MRRFSRLLIARNGDSDSVVGRGERLLRVQRVRRDDADDIDARVTRKPGHHIVRIHTAIGTVVACLPSARLLRRARDGAAQPAPPVTAPCTSTAGGGARVRSARDAFARRGLSPLRFHRASSPDRRPRGDCAGEQSLRRVPEAPVAVRQDATLFGAYAREDRGASPSPSALRALARAFPYAKVR